MKSRSFCKYNSGDKGLCYSYLFISFSLYIANYVLPSVFLSMYPHYTDEQEIGFLSVFIVDLGIAGVIRLFCLLWLQCYQFSFGCSNVCTFISCFFLLYLPYFEEVVAMGYRFADARANWSALSIGTMSKSYIEPAIWKVIQTHKFLLNIIRICIWYAILDAADLDDPTLEGAGQLKEIRTAAYVLLSIELIINVVCFWGFGYKEKCCKSLCIADKKIVGNIQKARL